MLGGYMSMSPTVSTEPRPFSPSGMTLPIATHWGGSSMAAASDAPASSQQDGGRQGVGAWWYTGRGQRDGQPQRDGLPHAQEQGVTHAGIAGGGEQANPSALMRVAGCCRGRGWLGPGVSLADRINRRFFRPTAAHRFPRKTGFLSGKSVPNCPARGGFLAGVAFYYQSGLYLDQCSAFRLATLGHT